MPERRSENTTAQPSKPITHEPPTAIKNAGTTPTYSGWIGPTGTLYGALRRLLEENWIERFEASDTSRGKQAYRLTATGRRHLQAEVHRMRQLSYVASLRLERMES